MLDSDAFKSRQEPVIPRAELIRAHPIELSGGFVVSILEQIAQHRERALVGFDLERFLGVEKGQLRLA